MTTLTLTSNPPLMTATKFARWTSDTKLLGVATDAVWSLTGGALPPGISMGPNTNNSLSSVVASSVNTSAGGVTSPSGNNHPGRVFLSADGFLTATLELTVYNAGNVFICPTLPSGDLDAANSFQFALTGHTENVRIVKRGSLYYLIALGWGDNYNYSTYGIDVWILDLVAKTGTKINTAPNFAGNSHDPSSFILSPDDNFGYVRQLNAIYGFVPNSLLCFSIDYNTGILTELNNSPVGMAGDKNNWNGTVLANMMVFKGSFLYILPFAVSIKWLEVFKWDSTTGEISRPANSIIYLENLAFNIWDSPIKDVFYLTYKNSPTLVVCKIDLYTGQIIRTTIPTAETPLAGSITAPVGTLSALDYFDGYFGLFSFDSSGYIFYNLITDFDSIGNWRVQLVAFQLSQDFLTVQAIKYSLITGAYAGASDLVINRKLNYLYTNPQLLAYDLNLLYRFSGTPTTPGVYNWTISATDSLGNTGTLAMTATVLPLPTKYIERQGIVLTTETRVEMIKTVFLNMESTGPLTIYIGSQYKHLKDPIIWKKRTFDPATQDHVSALVSGRYLALRIESDMATHWVLNSITLEKTSTGKF